MLIDADAEHLVGPSPGRLGECGQRHGHHRQPRRAAGPRRARERRPRSQRIAALGLARAGDAAARRLAAAGRRRASPAGPTRHSRSAIPGCRSARAVDDRRALVRRPRAADRGSSCVDREAPRRARASCSTGAAGRSSPLVHVMTAELGHVLRAAPASSTDSELRLDDEPGRAPGSACYRQDGGSLPAAARAILTNHPAAVFASLRDGDRAIAIARAAVDDRWAGRVRRRGRARASRATGSAGW